MKELKLQKDLKKQLKNIVSIINNLVKDRTMQKFINDSLRKMGDYEIICEDNKLLLINDRKELEILLLPSIEEVNRVKVSYVTRFRKEIFNFIKKDEYSIIEESFSKNYGNITTEKRKRVYEDSDKTLYIGLKPKPILKYASYCEEYKDNGFTQTDYFFENEIAVVSQAKKENLDEKQDKLNMDFVKINEEFPYELHSNPFVRCYEFEPSTIKISDEDEILSLETAKDFITKWKANNIKIKTNKLVLDIK